MPTIHRNPLFRKMMQILGGVQGKRSKYDRAVGGSGAEAAYKAVAEPVVDQRVVNNDELLQKLLEEIKAVKKTQEETITNICNLDKGDMGNIKELLEAVGKQPEAEDKSWFDGIKDVASGRAVVGEEGEKTSHSVFNYLFGSLQHTYFNLTKYNNAPMLTSLLILMVCFSILNYNISDDIPEIRQSGDRIDKIVASIHVTVKLLTFRSLRDPPRSSITKLLIIIQQVVFFLILLFFFQHYWGTWIIREWVDSD